jgi:EAL domain-containing protein (putative c-di-GMP-specific phosphodiesterase class I)
MENGFLDMLQFLMEAYGLSGKKIHFEIMEDTIPENMDTFIRLLEKIRKMGIGIAIDDYGTGHTSLKYLMHFPIDYLKIDKSFVTNIDKNKKTFLLFKTIIDMAKALDMKVIAEGVENHLEDEVLQMFDDLTVQGYLYSKPLDQDMLLKKLIL